METVDNEVLQALSARKSVRVYTDEPVTEAERNAILQAAFQAPTAGNQQLYTILNITDPALKASLADLCDHQPFIAKAPLVLAEIFCIMRLENWVIPVTVRTAIVCAINFREIFSMLNKLVGEFHHRKKE